MIIAPYQNNTDPTIDKLINDYRHTLQTLISNPNTSNKKKHKYNRALSGGNYACAYYNINGNTREYIAHSGFNSVSGRSFLDNTFNNKYTIGYRPNLFGRKNTFATDTLDDICSPNSLKYERWDDTESKILETIDYEHKNQNFSQDIIIWTRRYPCPSCRCVIIAFEKKYKVNITVFYEIKYNNNPCDQGVGCP